jgi:hypothetical protein
MSEQEKRIQDLEALIPAASGEAFAAAYQQAVKSGQPLVQTIGLAVCEVRPDSPPQIIKQLEEPLHVTPGTRVKIR